MQSSMCGCDRTELSFVACHSLLLLSITFFVEPSSLFLVNKLQVARAAAVFCVDEIVVYDETARMKPQYIYSTLFHSMIFIKLV